MTSMSVRVAALGVSLVALLVGPLLGQEPGATTKPAKGVQVRRVPPHFGQIGLTPEQREKIYSIRGAHHQKISELRAQIEQAEKAMLSDCEAVLTDVQKGLLRQRRDSARSSKAKASAKDQGEPASEGR